MANRKLVLFDIDGVLIKENVGKRLDDRWFFALKEVFGVDAKWGDIDARGMTDGLILLALAESVGIGKPEVETHKDELFGAVSEFAEQSMSTATIELQDGVSELLALLKGKRHILGLLTGNLPSVAKAKLGKAGIYGFFDVGGFGNSFLPRYTLIGAALKTAMAKFEIKLSKNDIVYFGDTPKDIKAGHEAGVERVVGVATGGFSVKELEQHKPYAVLGSLKEIEKIAEIMGS